MKTLEELAEKYLDQDKVACDAINHDAEDLVKSAFLAGYKAAQGWISVKDRLPEDKRRVIYWHDEFGANVGHYDSTFPKQNYHWWSYNFGDSADFRVKWWMPLPEPPKEEKPITSLDQIHRPQKRISAEEAREMFPDKPPKEEK